MIKIEKVGRRNFLKKVPPFGYAFLRDPGSG